jgi:hypothetical protein
MMNSKKYAAVATLLTLGAGATSIPSSIAATRTLERSIEFGVLASDNPTLALNSDSTGYAASITPAVEVEFDNKNFDTQVVGEVQYLRFTDPERDVLDPRVRARTVGTLVQNLAYLDASFRLAKVVTDEDLFRVTEDTDHTLRLQLNPYIEHSYGTFADLNIQYFHQTVDQSFNGSAESIRNGLSIELGRDPALGGVVWGVGGSYNLDKGGTDRVENTTVYGGFGLTLAQSYLIEARAGAEQNDFVNIDEEDRESEFWNVDFTWTASERTSFTVGYESRFFDDGPTFRAEHRTRNSEFSASWTRSLTRTRVTLDDLSVFGDTANDNLALQPTDDSTLTAPEPFVGSTIRLGYKLTGRVSDLVVDAVYSEQDQISGDDQIDLLIGRLAFDRRLNRSATLRLAYTYQDSESSSGQQSQNFTENRIGAYLKYNFR